MRSMHTLLAISSTLALISLSTAARAELQVGREWTYTGTRTLEFKGKAGAPVDFRSSNPLRQMVLVTRQEPKGWETAVFYQEGKPDSPDRAWTSVLPSTQPLPSAPALSSGFQLPIPFDVDLMPGEKRQMSARVSPVEGYGVEVPVVLEATGEEPLGGQQALRLERKTREQLPQALGGMQLQQFTERFWVDRRSGALLKYSRHLETSVQSAEAALSVREKVELELVEVRDLPAAEAADRRTQAWEIQQIGKFLELLVDPNVHVGNGIGVGRKYLQKFREDFPRSPYAAAAAAHEQRLAEIEAGQNSEKRRAGLRDSAAAPDLRLRDLEGRERTLKSFRGRVVLISFFASWCVPCHREAPHLEKDYWQKLKDRGLVVIGINSGEAEEPEARAREFRDLHRLTYPILVDRDGKAARALAVEAWPTNILIDRQGRVRYLEAGFDREALDRLLVELLQ